MRIHSILLFFFVSITAFPSFGKLLDKIVAVIDDKIITYSEVQRIQDNQQSRRNISPQIYYKNNLSNEEIVKVLINTFIVREKLGEVGYKITDEQVEEQIKGTEQRLGLSREALLKFLSENSLTFEEYFEIIRATIEYNIFRSRIIIPLITVTDQQIKNAFFNRHMSNKTMSFKYNLIGYTIHRDEVPSQLENDLLEIVKKYHTNGVLPEELRNLEASDLGNITEDGLTRDIVDVLKKTDEGAFSMPILINNQYHIFYVRKKDLEESEVFLKEKDRIREELYEIEANKISDIWMEKEAEKHYIKSFFNNLP